MAQNRPNNIPMMVENGSQLTKMDKNEWNNPKLQPLKHKNAQSGEQCPPKTNLDPGSEMIFFCKTGNSTIYHKSCKILQNIAKLRCVCVFFLCKNTNITNDRKKPQIIMNPCPPLSGLPANILLYQLFWSWKSNIMNLWHSPPLFL